MFTLRFEVRDKETNRSFGEIEMDVDSDGDIQGLYLDGEDYSYNGEVLDAVVKLLGADYIQRRCSDLAASV